MGGICSICTDPKGEPTKRGALTTTNQNDVLLEGVSMLDNAYFKDDNRSLSMVRREQERLEEAARLELIVSNAGRDMVPVRSTRGATYYHDQGFAAALLAHLQQTLPRHTWRPKLPAVAAFTTSATVVTTLARPVPAPPEDRRWESLLNQTSGSTEQIFAKCQIVESLL
ncbi:hypothetical protein MHU86_14626 [Fragilaria crotonensis]|nr:hypothetical protein MHU86_14626 [Fragilaria crotonensis]